MPYFSVLLPVRNSQSSILNCLHSIASQTFRDFSVLVLVNNSNDATFDICSEFCASAPNFDLVNLYQSCQSLPEVLNVGIDKLRLNCEYIVRHDADDYMLPHRLLDTYRSIQAACPSPLVHCGNAYINNTSRLYFSPEVSITDYQIKSSLLLSFLHLFTPRSPSSHQLKHITIHDIFMHKISSSLSIICLPVLTLFLRFPTFDTQLPLLLLSSVLCSFHFMILQLIVCIRSLYLASIYLSLISFVVSM